MTSPNNPPVALDRLNVTQSIQVFTANQYEDLRTLMDWLVKGAREHTVRLNALSENALRGRKVEEDLARLAQDNDSMKLSFEAIEERTTAVEGRTEVAENSLKTKLSVDTGDTELRRKMDNVSVALEGLKTAADTVKEVKDSSSAFANDTRLEMAKMLESLKDAKKRVETLEAGPAGQLLVMGIDLDSLVELPRQVQDMRDEMTNKLASLMDLPEAPTIEVPSSDDARAHRVERTMGILGVQQQTMEEKHARQADKIKEMGAQLRELKTQQSKLSGMVDKFGDLPSTPSGEPSEQTASAYKMAEEAIRVAEKAQTAVDSLLEHVEVLQTSKKRLEKTMESRLSALEESLAAKVDTSEVQSLLKNRSNDMASAVKGALANVKSEKAEANLGHMASIVEAMHERLETAEGQIDYLDQHVKDMTSQPKVDKDAVAKIVDEQMGSLHSRVQALVEAGPPMDEATLGERFQASDDKVARCEEAAAAVRNLIEEHAAALQELSETSHQLVKRDEYQSMMASLNTTIDEKADKEMVTNMMKLATPQAAPSSPGAGNDARWAQFMKILQDIQNTVGKKAERGEVSGLRAAVDSTKAEVAAVKTLAKAAAENPKLPEVVNEVTGIKEKLEATQPIIEALQNRAAHWLTSADLKPLALIQEKLEAKADRADLDSMIDAMANSRGASAAAGEIGAAQVQALQEAVAVHSEQLKRKAGSGDVTQLRQAVEELKQTLEEAAAKAANSTQETKNLKKRLDEAARRESSTRSQAAGAIDAQKQQLRRLQQMIATSVSELRNDVDSKLPRSELSAGESRILNKVQELLAPLRDGIDSTQQAHAAHKAEHAKVASTASGAAASAKAANLAADEQYRRMEAHEARLQELCDLLIRCGEGVLLLAAGGGGLEMPATPGKGSVADGGNVQVTSAKKGANWRPLPPRALIGKFDQIMRVPGSFNQKANMNQMMTLQAELQRAAARILQLEEQYEGLEPDLGKKADKAELRKLAKMIDVNRKTVVTDTAMLYNRSPAGLRCMSCDSKIDTFPSNMVPTVPTNSMPKPTKLASLTESTNFGGGGMSAAGLNRIQIQKQNEAHAAAAAAGLSRPPAFQSPSPAPAGDKGVVGGPFWERSGDPRRSASPRSQSPNSMLPPLDQEVSDYSQPAEQPQDLRGPVDL